jgi:hypothetical protein
MRFALLVVIASESKLRAFSILALTSSARAAAVIRLLDGLASGA